MKSIELTALILLIFGILLIGLSADFYQSSFDDTFAGEFFRLGFLFTLISTILFIISNCTNGKRYHRFEGEPIEKQSIVSQVKIV